MGSHEHLQPPPDTRQEFLRRKAKHRPERIEAPPRAPKVRPSLSSYNPLTVLDPLPGEMVTVNHGASGIGDGLLGLLAVTGLREKLQRPIRYKVGPNAYPWVGLFCGWDELAHHETDTPVGQLLDVPPRHVPGDREMNQGYSAELGTRSLMSRLGRYLRNVGADVPCTPPLRDVERCLDLGGAFAGSVILCPFTHYDSRAWPKRHWAELALRLDLAGLRVVLCVHEANCMEGIHGERLAGAEPARVAGAFLCAGAVCSIDSGLAHLSGILGTPTVVLSAVTNGRKIFDCYGSTLALPGPLNCTGCYWQAPYKDQDCLPRCPSMAALDPRRVAAAVRCALRLPALDYLELPGYGSIACKRRSTFTHFLRHILGRGNAVVVETGCQRAVYDPGTGESTSLLALAALAAGGSLTSIDTSAERLALAAEITKGLPVSFQHCRGDDWFTRYRGQPIDAIYLDSHDCELPGYGETNLAEVKAALPHLAEDAIVMIDDTVLVGGQWGGKGALTVPFLLSCGWRLLAHGYQALLSR